MSSRNEQIMKNFPKENSWEQNYQTIIKLGKELAPFDELDKTDKWLIKACQSPLWLKVKENPEGKLVFTGDSTALISKGLLALMIAFYTNKKPEEILNDPPQFIEQLNLSQYISSRRTNGLQGMLDQISNYAKAFLILSQQKGKQV